MPKTNKTWNYLLFIIIFIAITGSLPVILRIFFEEELVNSLGVYISVAIELLLIAPVAFIFLKKEKFDFENLKLPKFNALSILKIIIYSLIAFIVARLFSDGAKWIAYGVNIDKMPINAFESDSAVKFIFSIIYLGLIPAFCEELYYRVYGFEIMKNYSFKVKLVLLAPSFALAHIFSGFYTVLSVFIISIFIITIYEKTRSFYAAFSVHFIYNILILFFNMIICFPTDLTKIEYVSSDIECIFLGLIYIAASILICLFMLLFGKDLLKQNMKSE